MIIYGKKLDPEHEREVMRCIRSGRGFDRDYPEIILFSLGVSRKNSKLFGKAIVKRELEAGNLRAMGGGWSGMYHWKDKK